MSRCLPRSQRSPNRLTGLPRHLRDLIGIGEAGRAEAAERQDLVLAEAGQRQVEAEAFEIAELQRQQFGIPAGVERQLVVGDDVGALLRFREPGELDDGHFGEPELACREQPAVAGDDAVVAIDQDRVGPAELADRGGDLGHLRIRMRAGVAGVGDQRCGGTVFHRKA